MKYTTDEINFFDMEKRMWIYATSNPRKVLVHFGDGEKVEITLKTAINEAKRRKFHTQNLQFYDLDGTPYHRDNVSKKLEEMSGAFLVQIFCPYLRKDLRDKLNLVWQTPNEVDKS